ncbi:hypothetical protein [Maribacter sp. LLG6340-A2]|uniref:hypothetical protein n=1 Tax=Maribacter sp. LLG6340-A2 TaxID=3160834 RepID=UPI003870B003
MYRPMLLSHTVIKFIFLLQVWTVAPQVVNDSLGLEKKDSIDHNELYSPDTALGVWRFSFGSESINEVYKDGVLFVTKQNGKYDIAMKFKNGILTGQDVVISEDSIKFNVNIDGLERVSFVLLLDGNRIMGQSYSAKGASKIFGVRQVPVR